MPRLETIGTQWIKNNCAPIIQYDKWDRTSLQNFVLTPFGCGLCKRLLPPDFPTGSRVFFYPYRYRQHVLKVGSVSSVRCMKRTKCGPLGRKNRNIPDGRYEREHAVPEERCGCIHKTEDTVRLESCLPVRYGGRPHGWDRQGPTRFIF